jgi:hypothetical protein
MNKSKGDRMTFGNTADVVLGLLYYGTLGAPAVLCLLFIVLFVIRRLNETVFDADWRFAHQAERRRIKAWDQWDEEMRAWKTFETESSQLKDRGLQLLPAATHANTRKPDSPANGPHGIMG